MNSTRKKIAGRSDEFLVQDLKTNQPGAFDALVLRYKDMVFNLCYNIMNDYDDANDCAQDTFIKIYKNIQSFREDAQLSTWIYRIAVNTCKNSLSSLSHRMKKKSLSINNTEYDDTNPLEIQDDSFSPEAILEKKETKQAIMDAIQALPGKKRILVILRDLEGKSYEEISQITGLNIGTVKSKLARSRQLIRESLKGVLQL